MPLSYSLSRVLFLRLLSCVYLCAFVSVYLQWQGLFSCDGLEPVYSHLNKVSQTHGPRQAIHMLPTLAWLYQHEWIGMDVDLWMECLCLLGCVLSLIVCITGLESAWAFAALWMLYSSIQAVGQNFLSFQWDILLIDVGFSAIFLSGSIFQVRFESIFQQFDWILARNQPTLPYLQLKSGTSSNNNSSKKEQTVATVESNEESWFHSFLPTSRYNSSSLPLFLLRFLLFRLMFASGVVKILSECRSWNAELTALEYHYATQCLPTPLAWFFHQLPPFIQQFSVAATLYVEIIGAFLLLLPTTISFFNFARQVGYIWQIALQILIILSGNYTFFNWLTIALCICFVSDQDWIFFMHILSPWRWCRQHSKHVPITTLVADEKNRSSGDSGKKEVELQPLDKKKSKDSSSSSSSSSTAASPPFPSAPRKSFVSLLLRVLYFLICLALKVAFFGAITWSFLQFYRITWKTTTASKSMFSMRDILPNLSALHYYEVPYALLLYVTYYFQDFDIDVLYTPNQIQKLLDQHLIHVIQASCMIGVGTVIGSFYSLISTVYVQYNALSFYHLQRGSGCGRKLVVKFIFLIRAVWKFIRFAILTGICSVMFCASLYPFTQSVSPVTMSKLPPQLHRAVRESFAHVQHYHIANSYGLFRSMTGMGPDQMVDVDLGMGMASTSSVAAPGAKKQKQKVTTVHRPELMIEGSFDGETWYPLHFRYKPNDLMEQRPQFIAPYQPRLDWQMWFAALGKHPPAWLVHLLSKLLEPSSASPSAASPSSSSSASGSLHHPVWDLMDVESGGKFSPSSPPKYVRIEKKLLDFTRLPYCDSGRLSRNHRETLMKQSKSHKLTPSNLGIPRAWWRESGETVSFLPPIDASNPSVQNFLAKEEWVNVCGKMRQQFIRTKGAAQKEKIFEAIPEKDKDGTVAAAKASASAVAAKWFKSNNPWELHFYLSWLEDHLPASKTYGPFARSMKRIVIDVRQQVDQLQHINFKQISWMQLKEARLLHMSLTAIAVVFVFDYLVRY